MIAIDERLRPKNGEKFIQFSWSDDPNTWINFEPLKSEASSEAQMQSIMEDFKEVKRFLGLDYDIQLRVEPAHG